MKILYVTPVYKPAIGGGVIYLELFAQYISKKKEHQLTIITEKHPESYKEDAKNGKKFKIIRLFPFRAGMSKKNTKSYLKYIIQNLQFLTLPFLIKKEKADVVFIHSSFHNNPSLMSISLRLIKQANKDVIIISDIRDPKLPEKKLKCLNLYNKIISCSDNITIHISKNQYIKEKIYQVKIPIAQNKESNVENDANVLEKYGLNGLKYLFNGSGSSIEKGIKKHLNLTRQIRLKNHEFYLVVAGRRRYWDKELENAVKDGWLIFLDIIPHVDTLTIARNSIIDINLSSVDSMPRHTLEVLSYGTKVLLPEGVPEFEQCCQKYIAKNPNNIKELANKVETLILSSDTPPYNYTQHFPKNVFDKYDHIINQN